MYKPNRFLIGFGLVLVLSQFGWVHNTHSEKPSSPSPAATTLKLDLDFGKMPLYFVENQGQVDRQVSYYIQGRDQTIYFTPKGVTFAISSPAFPTQSEKAPAERNARFSIFNPKSATSNHRWSVKLDFVGANPDARPAGQEPTQAVISYFKGQPDQWHTALPTFQRIVYKDLWPGIDLAFFGTSQSLEYEFTVHPGADPMDIRLAYRGATAVSLNSGGQIEVTTPLSSFSDQAPLAYQDVRGQRLAVPVAYNLASARPSPRIDPSSIVARPSSGLLNPHSAIYYQQSAITHPQSYTFSLGRYDPSLPLVIDPAVLVYAGFIGGSAYDYGYGIAVDGTGNAYIVGDTPSSETSFPVKGGPDLSFNGGEFDAFVAKVKADGTGLDYAGYIGGSGDDDGYGIAIDGEGDAYITGQTDSPQATFPLKVGPDLTFNGTSGDLDAFVAKVNPTGSGLVYAGYIGGSAIDFGIGIALDGSENAYVTGATSSSETSFPVKSGPDLSYNSGASDAFVARVKADGTGLDYAGYIGGSGEDRGSGIAIDETENAYVIGQTASTETSFPVMGGPDLTYNGGSYDAFVARVNAGGTGLGYAGYIGGTGTDRGTGIALDGLKNAYVTGESDSPQASFPVKVGPDLTHNGGRDAFVAEVNPSGSELVYAGYIGGSASDFGIGIALDGTGNAYVTGGTSSSEASFPVVGGPDPTYNSGASDAFVARVNAGGTGLDYAGYIGGDNNENGYGIAVDGTGNAYVTGYTYSTQASFPAIGGPDLTHNGFADAFVARVKFLVPQLYLPFIER